MKAVREPSGFFTEKPPRYHNGAALTKNQQIKIRKIKKENRKF